MHQSVSDCGDWCSFQLWLGGRSLFSILPFLPGTAKSVSGSKKNKPVLLLAYGHFLLPQQNSPEECCGERKDLWVIICKLRSATVAVKICRRVLPYWENCTKCAVILVGEVLLWPGSTGLYFFLPPTDFAEPSGNRNMPKKRRLHNQSCNEHRSPQSENNIHRLMQCLTPNFLIGHSL